VKVWEETWYRRHNSACRWELRQERPGDDDVRTCVAQFDDYDWVNADEKVFIEAQGARAQLAAAAPEMARVLLELLGPGGDLDEAQEQEATRVLRKAGVVT
jgi:hypothetical protein